MSWPKWPNWKPDPVEYQIGANFIPEILQEYGDFKNVLEDPKLDHHIWYLLAYYNLSTFYNFAHAKYCILNISNLDRSFHNNQIDAIFKYDFYISGFFMSLRTALDTLAAQITLTFIHYVPLATNLAVISDNSFRETKDQATMKRMAGKYVKEIKTARNNWYDEFSKYRNHLDHGFYTY